MCICVCVCVQNLFAHGDKQLLCTPGPNPGLRMAAARGLTEHSHPLLHSTELASAGSSRRALRDPRHACACLGIFFGAWHSSPHTCQHFLSPSSLFSVFVLITSHCAGDNIAARSPLKPVTCLTLEVMERTRMETFRFSPTLTT